MKIALWHCCNGVLRAFSYASSICARTGSAGPCRTWQRRAADAQRLKGRSWRKAIERARRVSRNERVRRDRTHRATEHGEWRMRACTAEASSVQINSRGHVYIRRRRVGRSVLYNKDGIHLRDDAH